MNVAETMTVSSRTHICSVGSSSLFADLIGLGKKNFQLVNMDRKKRDETLVLTHRYGSDRISGVGVLNSN